MNPATFTRTAAAMVAENDRVPGQREPDHRPIERWHHDSSGYTGRVQFPYLDEFIAKNVDIHFETMGDTEFWMSVRCRETGEEWHLNCGAINSRARGYSIAEPV